MRKYNCNRLTSVSNELRVATPHPQTVIDQIELAL